MKTIDLPEDNLQDHYPLTTEANVPVTAVRSSTYVVSHTDLDNWVDNTYKTKEEQDRLYDALGVNTVCQYGIYLCDIENALRGLAGKPTYWD